MHHPHISPEHFLWVSLHLSTGFMASVLQGSVAAGSAAWAGWLQGQGQVVLVELNLPRWALPAVGQMQVCLTGRSIAKS